MLTKVISRTNLIFLLIILSLLYALVVSLLRIPPYSFLKETFSSKEHQEQTKTPIDFTHTPKEYTETDVAALISIRNQDDILKRRKALVRFLWGVDTLPKSSPSEIIKEIKDARYEEIENLKQINKIVVDLEFGLQAVMYHFIPKTPNNKVVLYHQGHGGDFHQSKKQIKVFIQNGYSVIGFSMPLLGLNNKPTVQLPRFGKLKLNYHSHMSFLTPKKGNSVKYFIEPVIVVVNYLENNFEYSLISMVGISGGGWSTTLAAAVDTRITKSFPVAGSYPFYLRSNSPRDWGDFEQNLPELYRTANYLELYILGAAGENRKQLQIINQFDSCCFAGTKSETYKEIVRDQVHQLGQGEYDLFLDSSHKSHMISEIAMQQILDELDKTD